MSDPETPRPEKPTEAPDQSAGEKSRGRDRKERSPGSIALYVILGVGLLLIVLNMFFGSRRGREIDFGEFEAGLRDGRFNSENVFELTFSEDYIRFQNRPATEAGDLVDGLGSRPDPQQQEQLASAAELERYLIPIGGIPEPSLHELRQLLREQGIVVKGSAPPTEWTSVLYFAFLLTLVFVFILFFRKMGGPGSAMSFARSRGRLYAEDDTRVTFDDVAGIEEAVAELREVVDFLRSPEKYQALGGRIPRGVLLVGPPGTGKTLLAKAVAGEARVPFFSLSGSDFVEMFVGVGAARVRDMFAQAVQKSPSIIFIDELDALGKARSGGMPGGHDEREQTLNALLVEMDGFSSDESVIVMGATNRPETLDPALMRPGRFDRHVLVDKPDYRGREAILKVHSSRVKLADDVDLVRLAKLTAGFAGADLANLVNEAALLAARQDKRAVTMEDFEEGVERVVAGLEKSSRIIHEEERQRVAYHECGHALVACLLPHVDPVHKISIIPRGYGALGYTLQRPEEDRHLVTQTELRNRICVLLGGIAAEEIIYDETSTGAQNDLERATDIARRMVMEFGMSERMGRVNYRESKRSPFLMGTVSGGSDYVHSEATIREIDLETKRIIDECMQIAHDLLAERRDLLVRLTEELIEVEVMDAAGLERILEEYRTGPDDPLGTGLGEESAGSRARGENLIDTEPGTVS